MDKAWISPPKPAEGGQYCTPIRGHFCTPVDKRQSARLSAAFPRRGEAITGALGDEPRLEVCDGAEDVKHELAGGRRGIEALLEADQVNASELEVLDGLEQLA